MKHSLSFIFQKLILIAAILFQVACKKGIPEIESLNKLSGFTLDQSVISLKSKTNTQSFNVSGNCDNNINLIEISFDGKKFESITIYSTSQSMTCSTNKRFSYTIDPTKNSQFNIPDSASSKSFYIRGSGDLGYTSLYTINIQFTGSTENFVTAGSGSQSTGSYILKGKVQTTSLSSNGTYILKGSIKVK